MLSGYCSDNLNNKIFEFKPKYFIDNIIYVQENENTYYSGTLCVIDLNSEIEELNFMENENQSSDKINPVRIEVRDNSTLWLVAGWEGENDFLGNLFCDKNRRRICNIQKQNNEYEEIILYKYEEDNV